MKRAFHVAHAEWLGRADCMPAALRSPPPDIPAIEVGPVLAFPGLVNSHDHLEFNCYTSLGRGSYADFMEWGADIHQHDKAAIAAVEAIPRSARLKIGLLKNLLAGVTSVAHHGTALPPDLDAPIGVISDFDSVHSPELEGNRRWGFLKQWRRRPLVLHIAEATTPESRARALDFMRWNVFGRRVIGVHGVALRNEDFSRLDALVWCPASNVFLFGRTADIAVAKKNTAILFGTDAAVSAPGTIWDHLRMARETGGLSDSELLDALTEGAERVWRLKNTDFVMARRRAPDRWEAFFAIMPADILLVVRNGRIVMADEEVLRASPDIGDSLVSLDLGSCRKWIRMDVESLAAAFDACSRSVDFASTVRRLAGVG